MGSVATKHPQTDSVKPAGLDLRLICHISTKIVPIEFYLSTSSQPCLLEILRGVCLSRKHRGKVTQRKRLIKKNYDYKRRYDIHIARFAGCRLVCLGV